MHFLLPPLLARNGAAIATRSGVENNFLLFGCEDVFGRSFGGPTREHTFHFKRQEIVQDSRSKTNHLKGPRIVLLQIGGVLVRRWFFLRV